MQHIFLKKVLAFLHYQIFLVFLNQSQVSTKQHKHKKQITNILCDKHIQNNKGNLATMICTINIKNNSSSLDSCNHCSSRINGQNSTCLFLFFYHHCHFSYFFSKFLICKLFIDRPRRNYHHIIMIFQQRFSLCQTFILWKNVWNIWSLGPYPLFGPLVIFIIFKTMY